MTFKNIKDSIKNKNPFRRDKIDKQIVEKQTNKENSMSEFQGKNKSDLNYKKVNDAINIAKKKKNIDSLKSNLDNFSTAFNNLEKNEKQEELKSEKFKQLVKYINALNNDKLSKIIKLMENQKELSEYEKLSEQIENLASKLDTIEKENSQSQEDIAEMVQSKKEIDKISKIIDNSFWNNLKNKIPKLDLSSITQKIDSIKNELKQNKNDINNSNQALSKKIDNIKLPTIPPFPTIPNDYLKKEDFEFTINDKLKDLKEIKESSENLETVPAKVNSIENELKILSEKLDNLPSSNGSQTPKHIPTEEKSVIELAKYMTDGVAQFENIAKEYISKISELKKLDKIKETHQIELEKVKEEEFESGKEAGKIELIKNLAENFPTEFKAIQSTFEDLLEEKFEKDKTLEIDDKNINEMLLFIENKIENGNYKVISPALLVDKEILFKASVEKVD
jgi:DNA repair exonuclease SbcCD ATPase subunit